MQFWTFPSTFLAVLSLGGGARALFDCNKDQHAFPPTAGKFVVHYTSIRDTNYKGQPWVGCRHLSSTLVSPSFCAARSRPPPLSFAL